MKLVIAFMAGLLLGEGITIFLLALGWSASIRDDWKEEDE